jgi:hypothetical protein
MKRWLIRLSGAQTDLDDLIHWFPCGQSYAFAEDGVTYIASERFQVNLNYADIAEEAKMLLASWQPAIELLSPGFQTLVIDAVVEEDDDGMRKAIVLAEGHIKMRFRARARADESGPTQAQIVWKKTQENPILHDVLSLWGMPNRTWPHLYRILEEIERYVGGKADKTGLCTTKERGRFAASANNAKISGLNSRHADGKYPPPSDPMHIEEATAFIRDLVLDAMRKQ